MDSKYYVYDDDIIAICLFVTQKTTHIAMRWLKPQPYLNLDGLKVESRNVVSGETEWFILPATMGSAIGKRLVEQKCAGLTGFREDGYRLMVQWLVEDEELCDAMCY